MRVVQVRQFGGPDVLVAGQAPEPVAGPGQVLVEVAVVAIDFVQTQLRRGFTPGPPLPELPYIPHSSVAGVVVALGPGVDPKWTGRRVVVHTASGAGGAAERAVAEAAALIEIPDAVPLEQAAALLDDGSTALGLVENAQLRPGEWVLVEAAAGGVGSLLVQLARAAGAKVVGAARGKPKLDLVRALGAEAVVDYSEPDWPAQVREATGGRGPDVVFDGVGGTIGRAAFGVTAPGGRFSVHGASSGATTVIDSADAQRADVTVIPLAQLFEFHLHLRPRVERALALVAQGQLKPSIGLTLPLEQAGAAHAAIEARKVLGKTLLTT